MGKSKTKKQRFTFDALENKKALIKAGDECDDVYQIQNFLRASGYLGRDCLPGTLCPMTSAALQHFQKCYSLEDSGDADRDTLELMQRPRCGNEDVSPDANTSGPAPFVLRGCKYPTTNLTYAFLNSTPDLSVDRQRQIIREAFEAWASVSALTFTEVDPSTPHTFPISFHHGAHGDGSPFDAEGSINGNTLAHAFYPPNCGGIHAGALHFDEFEDWTDESAPGKIRLLNVAIHEIGHLLGLAHSNEQDAIMFAFYDDNVDSLRDDDINGIRELYGPRPLGITPLRGELDEAGQNEIHRVSATSGTMRATLRGPRDADFDLYVRSGTAPTRQLFDARGFTASSNEELTLAVSGGDVFIMVDSWRGSGRYELDVVFE